MSSHNITEVVVSGSLDLADWEKATLPLRPLKNEIVVFNYKGLVLRECSFEILERVGDTIQKIERQKVFLGDRSNYGVLVNNPNEISKLKQLKDNQ